MGVKVKNSPRSKETLGAFFLTLKKKLDFVLEKFRVFFLKK